MANNLDRLFREGIDQYEVTPKAESWSAVQSQLAKKKKIAWIPMSIAAAIILMIMRIIMMCVYRGATGDFYEYCFGTLNFLIILFLIFFFDFEF